MAGRSHWQFECRHRIAQARDWTTEAPCNRAGQSGGQMKPFDEAVKYLNRELVGKTVMLRGLRKPRVIHTVSIELNFMSANYGEPVVVVHYDGGHRQFSQGDEVVFVPSQ